MKYSPFQVQAFTHAARAGSFSRAASRLGVTQSAVSQHVGKLEQSIGSRLFVRRRDGLELTHAGRELYGLCDRLVDAEQLVEEKIQAFSNLDEGELTIVATATRPAMSIISAYVRKYPKVKITFALQSWTRCMEAMGDKSADIAVVTEPERQDALVQRPLNQTQYVAYLNTEHPLAKRRQLSLSELAGETVILPEDGSLTQKIVAGKLQEYGFDFPRVIKTTTFLVLKEAVLHGVGAGLFLRDSHYPSEFVAFVPIKEMPETYTNYLVLHEDKQDLRLLSSFIDVTDGMVSEL